MLFVNSTTGAFSDSKWKKGRREEERMEWEKEQKEKKKKEKKKEKKKRDFFFFGGTRVVCSERTVCHIYYVLVDSV